MSEIKLTDRILDSLNRIDERLNRADISLVEIKGDLKAHMSRTAAVEQSNALLQQHIDLAATKLDARVVKLEKWSDKFHYLGWLLFATLGCLDQTEKIKAIFHYFSS